MDLHCLARDLKTLSSYVSAMKDTASFDHGELENEDLSMMRDAGR